MIKMNRNTFTKDPKYHSQAKKRFGSKNTERQASRKIVTDGVPGVSMLPLYDNLGRKEYNIHKAASETASLAQ